MSDVCDGLIVRKVDQNKYCVKLSTGAFVCVSCLQEQEEKYANVLSTCSHSTPVSVQVVLGQYCTDEYFFRDTEIRSIKIPAQKTTKFRRVIQKKDLRRPGGMVDQERE